MHDLPSGVGQDRSSSIELADLVAAAHRHGWAVGNLGITTLQYQATNLGWTPVATRKGDDAIAVLRPTMVESANPQSLSAIYGLTEFPLHTDGAHLLVPPDIVVLHAAQPNNVPSLLWSPFNKLTNPNHPTISLPSHLRGGLFLVKSGKGQFLASAYAENVRFRFDPGSMEPCDQRARETVQYFEHAMGRAHRHDWTTPDQVLVIDNRLALHARADASASVDERIITRIAYQTKVEM
jgi:alpha-ketoglutarate-dependent taurine dioxygenase